MKKGCILFILLMLLVAGCSAQETTGQSGGFTFTISDRQIHLHEEAAPVIEFLGQPLSYTEETSCAFDGLDKTYCYGGFYVSTYPMDGKDYIYSIWFADRSVATEEGIRIGSTQTEVEAAYGAENFNGVNAYVMVMEDTKLTIILEEGLVYSVQYEAVVD